MTSNSCHLLGCQSCRLLGCQLLPLLSPLSSSHVFVDSAAFCSLPSLWLISVLFLLWALLAPAFFNDRKRPRVLLSSLVDDGGVSAHSLAIVVAASLSFCIRCLCRLLSSSSPTHHLLIVVLCLCRLPTNTCIVDVIVRVVAAVAESPAESSILLLPHCCRPLLALPCPCCLMIVVFSALAECVLSRCHRQYPRSRPPSSPSLIWLIVASLVALARNHGHV